MGVKRTFHVVPYGDGRWSVATGKPWVDEREVAIFYSRREARDYARWRSGRRA